MFSMACADFFRTLLFSFALKLCMLAEKEFTNSLEPSFFISHIQCLLGLAFPSLAVKNSKLIGLFSPGFSSLSVVSSLVNLAVPLELGPQLGPIGLLATALLPGYKESKSQTNFCYTYKQLLANCHKTKSQQL